jgi:hypothetical protein
MSKKSTALVLSIFLASCQKSDVENCVDAHLEAFDKNKSEYSEENEDRSTFKARIYIACGQAMVRQ